MNRPRLALLVALGLALGEPTRVAAHEGHHHEPAKGGAPAAARSLPAARHQGQVFAIGEHAFELNFDDAGISLVLMGADGGQVPVEALEADVVLRARSGSPETLKLLPASRSGKGADHLAVRRDLSHLKDGSRKATFFVRGLRQDGVSATLVLRRTRGPSLAPVKTADAYPLSWCVVSGDDLGGMGEAIEERHGDRRVRLCCKGCIATFRADPERYLAILDEAAQGKPARRPAGSGTSRPDGSSGGHAGSRHDH